MLGDDLCLPCPSLLLMLVGDKSRTLCIPAVTIYLKNWVRTWWTLLSFIESLRRASELQENSRANPLTCEWTYLHMSRPAMFRNWLAPRKPREISFHCHRQSYAMWAVIPPLSASSFQKPMQKPVFSSAFPSNIYRNEFS